jgi:hypothetical protein
MQKMWNLFDVESLSGVGNLYKQAPYDRRDKAGIFAMSVICVFENLSFDF